jgi:hypothetical protein
MSDSRAIAVPGDRVGIACDRTGIGRGRKSIIAAEAYPSGWPETDAQNGNDRRSRYGRFLTLAAFGVLVMAGSVNAVAQPAEADYRDPEQAPAVRAADLVSRMTLEEKAAQLQSAAPAVERLQIPAYHWWNEGLHGVARADEATVFPQAIGMAATWNPDLLKSVGDVVSTEFRAKFLKTVRSDGSSSIYRGRY